MSIYSLSVKYKRKMCILIYPQESFSSTKIINMKAVLKGIHLHCYVNTIHYTNPILELIYILCTFQELYCILTLQKGNIHITLDRLK